MARFIRLWSDLLSCMAQRAGQKWWMKDNCIQIELGREGGWWSECMAINYKWGVITRTRVCHKTYQYTIQYPDYIHYNKNQQLANTNGVFKYLDIIWIKTTYFYINDIKLKSLPVCLIVLSHLRIYKSDLKKYQLVY